MFQKLFGPISLSLLVASMFFSGCAARTAPTAETIGAARMAIREAEQADAQIYAPAELATARQKLENAEMAQQKENYTKSRRYAEQAVVDAQLSRAKAARLKASADLANAADATIDLGQEIRR